MATFKSVVITAKNHIKTDGTTNIKICVYHNGIAKHLKTPYYIEPEFMTKAGLIKDSHPWADTYNFAIGNMIQRCREYSLNLGSWRLSQMSCTELCERITKILGQNDDMIDFPAFAKEVILETKKMNTKSWFQTAVNILSWYMKREKFDIRELTGNKLNDFKKQLEKEGPCGKALKPGAISNYLRAIRSLIGKAKDKYNEEDADIIPKCPLGGSVGSLP